MTETDLTQPARRFRWGRLLLGLVLLASVAAGAVWYELRTARLQSWYFSRLASELDYRLAPGPSDSIRFPGQGPYDERHGYATLATTIGALERNGYAIDSQARWSPRLIELLDRGWSPIYRVKPRAGFRLRDRRDSLLFDGSDPSRIYRAFDSIPELVWRTLLFVEDRNLLREGSPLRNPAVNWSRLLRAATSLGTRRLGRGGPVAGASTLATQIEKFRHAPEGRTQGARDKLLQMASASVRAYLDGPETLAARRRIVTTYLNSAPFAGALGYGEVHGLGDALWAWYGADFEETNRLLREAADSAAPIDPERHGAAFRRVLQLVMAVQRPSYFLTDSAGQHALARRADQYLLLLEREGIIGSKLRAAARSSIAPRPRAPALAAPSFVERKAVDAVRTGFLGSANVAGLYQLDRLDALVSATFDGRAQAEVTELLARLRDPEFVRSSGLAVPRMLARGDPKAVDYAFVLYERTELGNVVRVQADNLEGPFSAIASGKLELGSTAKLRTLVTYLEIVERLHRGLTSGEDSVARRADDALSRWAGERLAADPAISLEALLDAAMERTYSASPAERFMTGGGLHTFRNFESTFDGRQLSVREAFRNSVNLVFIRMMRDVVRYHVNRLPGHPAGALRDRDDPRRQEYLARFADREGGQFIDRFLRKHTWTTRENALAALVEDRTLSRPRLAWAFRSIAPDAAFEEFAAFLRTQGEDSASAERVRELFQRADPARTSLVDRGFLSGVHPLELWVMEFRLRHPGATRAEVMDSSRTVRQEVYRWLFSTRRSAAQDERIRSILEVEAFFEIHRSWQRLGYPFASLVPSLRHGDRELADRPGGWPSWSGSC
ncbi:MAG: transglycosylase domain-containing protein [Gemmatimonadales bacterium]